MHSQQSAGSTLNDNLLLPNVSKHFTGCEVETDVGIAKLCDIFKIKQVSVMAGFLQKGVGKLGRLPVRKDLAKRIIVRARIYFAGRAKLFCCL